MIKNYMRYILINYIIFYLKNIIIYQYICNSCKMFIYLFVFVTISTYLFYNNIIMQMQTLSQQINTKMFSLEQDKLIDKLLYNKNKLRNVRAVDPIYSELFIVCEQNNRKNKKKRSKTLRSSNTRLQKNINPIQKQKSLTEMKKHNRSISFSHSIQLPRISKKFQQIAKQKKQEQVTFRKKQNKTEISSLRVKAFSQEKNNQFRKSQTKRNQTHQDLNNELMKAKKRFNTLNFEQQQKKMPSKKILNKKVKFQIQKKQKGQILVPAKLLKQWKELDILKLQTYFVKLKKLKNSGVLTHSKIELSKNISPPENFMPTQLKITDYIKSYSVKNTKVNIDNLVRSEKFGVLFQQGIYLYFGGIQNGKKSGFGIFVSNNLKYEGLWKKDEKIEGCEITNNGQFHGRFKNNKRHGQGNYIWKNGQTYDGEWANGFKNGLGIWKSGRGDSYIGQWINGKVEGHGVHITSTGQRYEGNFKNFLKNGTGSQTFPNGDKYEGQYKDGNPDGKGKYEWKNKVVFQGQFKQGYRQGKGTLTAKNYLVFVGNFIRDLPNGQGTLQYENGDKYVGDFTKGQKNGLGTLNLKSEQKILTGIWKNNKFEFKNQDQDQDS